MQVCVHVCVCHGTFVRMCACCGTSGRVNSATLQFSCSLCPAAWGPCPHHRHSVAGVCGRQLTSELPLHFSSACLFLLSALLFFYELSITEIQGICPLTQLLAGANKRPLVWQGRGPSSVTPFWPHLCGISASADCSPWGETPALTQLLAKALCLRDLCPVIFQS